MRVSTIIEVKIDITICDGRIDYKELLRALAEFDEIIEITTEEGLRIVSGSYEITLRIGNEKLPSTTRIEITGRTTSMSLMELAEKVNEIGGKILESVKD